METRIVGDEKEVRVWKLADVELNLLEKAIFCNMLNLAVGNKSIGDLKELGDVKAKRNGGVTVEFKVSEEKKASMLFSTKWGKYVYRDTMFFRNKKEKEM